MRYLKLYLLLFFIIFGLGVFLIFFLTNRQPDRKQPYLEVAGRRLWLQVADSPLKKTKGLSGRQSMAPNQGMLFVYNRPGRYLFWMMGMRFNLDFIFIDDEKIVDLVEDVPCAGETKLPARVKGEKPYDKVVEVNAGLIGKWGLKIGDEVNFRF